MLATAEPSPIHGISHKSPDAYTHAEVGILWEEVARNRNYQELILLCERGEGSNETEVIILELYAELVKRGLDPLHH